jgi:hypothetical protein
MHIKDVSAHGIIAMILAILTIAITIAIVFKRVLPPPLDHSLYIVKGAYPRRACTFTYLSTIVCT